MKTATVLVGLALAVAACQLQAQEGGRPPREGGAGRGEGGDRRGAEGGRRGGEEGGPGGEQRRPKPPIIAALDVNGDGTIDADEIAKASEALKKLDKNGDGKITREECMPPRPEGGGQGGEGRPGRGDGQGQEGRRGGGQRPELKK